MRSIFGTEQDNVIKEFSISNVMGLAKAIAFSACIVAAGFTGYSLREPETVTITKYKSLDYSDRTEMTRAWHDFPKELQYSLVKSNLKTMPLNKLYNVAQGVIYSRLNPDSKISRDEPKDTRHNYNMLKKYLEGKK